MGKSIVGALESVLCSEVVYMVSLLGESFNRGSTVVYNRATDKYQVRQCLDGWCSLLHQRDPSRLMICYSISYTAKSR